MKLWSGRFAKESAELTDKFNSSISFDKRLYKHDIKGSIAHSDMLGKKAIIPKADSEMIQKTLREILADIESGKLAIDEHAEDIHMFIETILTERIGDAGKKLHTGRSRNDQVALDMRMYVKDEINELKDLISALAIALINLAESNIDTVMPGYTHLQRAQPVTLAHHLLAYVEMLKRDTERLADAYKRIDAMPLGSGALAATTYPLDRSYVSECLGFSDITWNSLDAVSDRDFCIELLGALSIMMMHMSRFCEEIILWASLEFGFIELDDAYSTGSSIMPQKKNPDIAELIRGKTGRVYGSLVTLLTVMKGLPLAYNKDMQEDKEAVFDAIDTAKACLPAFLGMVSSMKINKDAMLSAAKNGFANATDAADYLVNKKGLPFRDAHEIIGKLILHCISNHKSLDELTLEEYRSFSHVFDESIFAAISLENCINSRKIEGGPAKEQTLKLILAGRKYFT